MQLPCQQKGGASKPGELISNQGGKQPLKTAAFAIKRWQREALDWFERGIQQVKQAGQMFHRFVTRFGKTVVFVNQSFLP